MKRFIALTLSVALILAMNMTVFAEETETTDSSSSLVTSSDGKSYDGLPDFPTDSRILGTRQWYIYTDYVLVLDDSDGGYGYILYCFSSNDEDPGVYTQIGDGYVRLKTSSYATRYDSEDNDDPSEYYGMGGQTYVLSDVDGVRSWTSLGSSLSNLYDSYYIVQSSCNIYSDSERSEVFFQPMTAPSLSGMSSGTLVHLMMKEILGLIPLVLGLVILALGLRKGLKMLFLALGKA